MTEHTRDAISYLQGLHDSARRHGLSLDPLWVSAYLGAILHGRTRDEAIDIADSALGGEPWARRQ